MGRDFFGVSWVPLTCGFSRSLLLNKTRWRGGTRSIPWASYALGVLQSLSVGFDALGGSLNQCLLGSYYVPDSAVVIAVQHILKTDTEFSIGKAWLLLSLPPLYPLLGSPRFASLC